ncbi:MAG: hypothetical protein J0L84_06285 [Verrucomicrobia bacterium]|nr:hypothetical protein [Verrucomicrobiota bacterium]
MRLGGGAAALRGWCLVGGLLGVAVSAQPLPLPTAVTARSVSGQFVVQGRGNMLPAPASEVRRVGTNQTITLRPDLLVVTAERTKRGLEELLDANDPWRGAVHLQIQETPAVAEPLAVQTRWFRDGWQFAVALPETVEWERLVRTLVEVSLLERANRANATAECALVPLWFTTGLHELLLAGAGRDLVTESGTLINRSERRPDPLRLVRAQLAGREPMTFGEFSLLGRDDLSDPARFRAYQASATLFVHEWLRDPGGRTAAAAFLRRLPENLNWQTTFLQVNGDRFPSLLDVEKWWAVASAEALASDASQRWSRERVLDRLAELLTETADVQPNTNSPAIRKTLPLRELIVTWDFDSQREMLLRKVSQLRALGLRSPPTIAPLVGDSARVLEEYVALRSGATRPAVSKSGAEVRGPMVAESAARRLAGLEARLEAERQVRLPEPVVPNDPARVVAPPGRPPSAVTGIPASGG